VFFMQAGFAMLEAGIVHPKNMTNILFKNICDASIAALCFWIVGYGFAYGESAGGFIGKDNFALWKFDNATPEWHSWFFQWAFTGACATIVAGSVAERTTISAYFVYSVVLSSFIYPVVVHWGWGTGWLSAWGAVNGPIFTGSTEFSNGFIDFAGSGIVHMVGGFSGLMGAIVVGPRLGRFDPDTGKAVELYSGNAALQALGTFILWFGWYGFNCGSTLAMSGGVGPVAGKVAINTTLSAATATMTSVFLGYAIEGHWNIAMGLNGALAGLVGITAPCSVVNPWMAFLIGFVSALILHGGHYLLLMAKIDDPCDAAVVHGFCGMWGCWAAGIFCTDENVTFAGYPNYSEDASGAKTYNNACGRAEQFGVQVVASLAIASWTIVMSGLLFFVISKTVGMRVDREVEEAGLDRSEHGFLTPEPLPEKAIEQLPQQSIPAPSYASYSMVQPQMSNYSQPAYTIQPGMG
jgi:Amt family ammonium transporter